MIFILTIFPINLVIIVGEIILFIAIAWLFHFIDIVRQFLVWILHNIIAFIALLILKIEIVSTLLKLVGIQTVNFLICLKVTRVLFGLFVPLRCPNLLIKRLKILLKSYSTVLSCLLRIWLIFQFTFAWIRGVLGLALSERGLLIQSIFVERPCIFLCFKSSLILNSR